MSHTAAIERVYILGAGKVGRALHRALRRQDVQATLRAARKGWPKRLRADVVLLSVRDADLAAFAHSFAQVAVRGETALLHCAGALAPEVLGPAARPGVVLGQLHPLLSFSDARHPPQLSGAYAHIAGQPQARRRAEQLCRLLDMRPISIAELDPTLYHAGAALLANGLAALVEGAVQTFVRAGIERPLAQQMLHPLLRSVVDNVGREGVPEALSGPVRRGAGGTIEAHLQALDRQLPEASALYRALVAAQLPMAEQLAEADERALARIRALLSE